MTGRHLSGSFFWAGQSSPIFICNVPIFMLSLAIFYCSRDVIIGMKSRLTLLSSSVSKATTTTTTVGVTNLGFNEKPKQLGDIDNDNNKNRSHTTD